MTPITSVTSVEDDIVPMAVEVGLVERTREGRREGAGGGRQREIDLRGSGFPCASMAERVFFFGGMFYRVLLKVTNHAFWKPSYKHAILYMNTNKLNDIACKVVLHVIYS